MTAAHNKYTEVHATQQIQKSWYGLMHVRRNHQSDIMLGLGLIFQHTVKLVE